MDKSILSARSAAACRRLTHLTAAALFLIAAAVSVNAQSARQRLEIEKAVTAVMSEQSAAWNRGDLEGFMNGYWRSEKLIFVSGNNVSRGWQPALDRYKKGYPNRDRMGVLTFSDLEIEVISKDTAVVLGSWRLKRKDDEPNGKFTLLFRRFKDGWRIVRDHTC